MAYSIPEFNLVADLWRFVLPLDFDTLVHVTEFDCKLRAFGGSPSFVGGNLNTASGGPYGVELLCPAGTDIRDKTCAGGVPDAVEVPIGSGRWYYVFVVDDVAKGFSNEYRFAIIGKIQSAYGVANAPDWPTPIP